MAERNRLICFSLLALNGVGAHGFAETVGFTRISGHVMGRDGALGKRNPLLLGLEILGRRSFGLLFFSFRLSRRVDA